MGDPTRRAARLRSAAFVAAVVAVVLLSIQLPNSALLSRIEVGVVGLGPWGAPAFAAIYAMALAIYLPALPFTLACGALFGPVVGSITAWVGSTVGSALGFLVVRHLVRDSVARRIRGHPKFLAFDQAVERSGWKVVALLRLTPMMPFVTLNALAGASAIRFWPFVLATAFAKLPGTIAVVYSGHVGRRNLGERVVRVDPAGPIDLSEHVPGARRHDRLGALHLPPRPPGPRRAGRADRPGNRPRSPTPPSDRPFDDGSSADRLGERQQGRIDDPGDPHDPPEPVDRRRLGGASDRRSPARSTRRARRTPGSRRSRRNSEPNIGCVPSGRTPFIQSTESPARTNTAPADRDEAKPSRTPTNPG